jgi:HupE / UreJ protein
VIISVYNKQHNMTSTLLINSRLMKRWRLLFFAIITAVLMPVIVNAHQSPNSLIFLDISPGKVAMEIQLPIPELELAFGNNISKDPATLIERLGPQLKEYIRAHVHAYITKNNPWLIEIVSLQMDKGNYLESGNAYWEVVAHITLKPQLGESTRKFLLDYDAILHQVINHVALVAIRSDWETGNAENNAAEARSISWNTKDNVIYPLEINLENGSWLQGFKNMLALGITHIKEGTDHLLFLLVLLLPSMLLFNDKRWTKFGGTKYSITRLLKIVTAFTIGHSLTLLIGALGWLRLPTQPVEVLIAFSILVSAIHAVYPIFPGKEIYVAAGFGLIHGLAFSSILSNLNLDAGPMALSILGFNIGIELMQLFVVIITVPWLILLSKTLVYPLIKFIGAAFAAIASIAWMAERISGTPNIIAQTVQQAFDYAYWLIIVLAIAAIGSWWYKKSSKEI